MIDTETICPYTGLRSFSEEESLYFKGRDEQIERVITQLEQKKFLMVTGASGDGKSSLIFAGLVPQSRAGFFKARYTNWKVISFRPERSPLSNLAKSFAAVLGMKDTSAVENELRHGFSSLVDSYKSSSLYVDASDHSWMDANEDQRLELERRSSNLMVIVDQFEEFFTNPENFPGGVPSQDARLVLNILLETVKISLRDDLPIYVVFTMRSDYIGQCAAFRGLPEFIGFSQFFVPRLQRKELQQVIEEPAVLSGNRISKRLSDRLIYDLEETEDRLPILQHVLKEIWKAADMGNEEMDLLHYAMVGGMRGDQLPKESLDRFKQWTDQLPPHRKQYLQSPGLANVLDIHATRLYDEAAATYNLNHTTTISEKDAKLIIGITFACLTRIDESRAVRNRMTLQEITQIVNVPSITEKIVDDVLQPFRSPDNTLIRPFLDAPGVDQSLSGTAVLDITHEALIRNWKLLNRWAAREYEYYNTLIDFRKQLQRWMDNKHSSDFLLPIGPLTYFETWFKNCRPNTYWINRYNQEPGEPESRLKQSQEILDHSRQFLRNSARRLFVVRTFMKYGARRISLAALALLVLVSSFFLLNTWWQRRNEVVINKLISEGQTLLSDSEADSRIKAEFIIVAERLQPGFFHTVPSLVPKIQDQIDVALMIPELIFGRSKESDPPLVLNSLWMADSLIQSLPVPDYNNEKESESYLNNLNDLLNLQLNYLYFKSNPKLKAKRERNAKTLGRFVYSYLTQADGPAKGTKKSLHVAMAHTLNFNGLSEDSLKLLTTAISPFAGQPGAKQRFEAHFPSRETIPVIQNQVIEHNGGYEMLASLYASLGESSLALRCMDSIRAYHKNYDENVVNSLNIAADFLLHNHESAFLEFVKEYSNKTGITRSDFLRALTNQAGIFGSLESFRSINRGNKNPNLVFVSGSNLDRLFDIHRAVINEDIREQNEKNFELSLAAKQQGLVLSKKARERNEKEDAIRITKLFDESLDYFRMLPAAFLEVPIFRMNGADFKKRKIFIISPDYGIIIPKLFARNFTRSFYGDAFYNYLKEKNLFSSLYTDEDSFLEMSDWVMESSRNKDLAIPSNPSSFSYQNYPILDHQKLVEVDSLITLSGFKQIYNPWLRLQRINDFLAKNENAKAVAELSQINLDKWGRDFIETVLLFSYSTQTAKELIKSGEEAHTSQFVKRFKRLENRVVTYAQLGVGSYEAGKLDLAARYLDSVRLEASKETNLTEFSYRSFVDLRNYIVRFITMLKGQSGRQEIFDLTGSMADKVEGIAEWSRTYAEMGKYYEAVEVIPELANPQDRLLLYFQILYVEAARRDSGSEGEWTNYDKALKEFSKVIIYAGDLQV